MVQPLLRLLIGGLAAAGGYALVKDHTASRERAAALQRAFIRFHERIRHEQFGERDLLRERRETLESRLREALNPDLCPRLFPQGSYALQTGIKPVSGEFDIDLGLVLQCRRSDFANPIEAKQGVRDALRQGSRRVRIRRSCVTVEYTGRELGDHHVDIAAYVQEPDGKMYLAKGKEHSEARFVLWEPAAPEHLTKTLNSKFQGADLAQFRRCVRYLKVWKQVNFDSKAPYSIALTVAAHTWLQPAMDGVLEPVPNDLEALLTLTGNMLSAVERGRLHINLPAEPRIDLLGRLTEPQMLRFLERLRVLHDSLRTARDERDVDASLQLLAVQFGADFR